MTNQAFNQWCARKEGWLSPSFSHSSLYWTTPTGAACKAEDLPNYASSLEAMLRVCEKQGWPYSLAYDKFSGHNTHKAMVGLTGCRWHPMARWHYAGTAEAALKAALVEVMESEKN